MKILTGKDLKENKEVMNKLDKQVADIIVMAASENGIREDVLNKIGEMELTEEQAIMLYPFLTNAEYSADWYPIFKTIMEQAENAHMCLGKIEEEVKNQKLNLQEIEKAYQDSETDFEFINNINRQEEEKQPAIAKKNGVTAIINKAEEIENVQVAVTDTQNNLYESFYKETMSDRIMVEDSKTDQHDVLVENVVKANNEYKDMKNRLKELERMVNLQNQMLQQYKENYMAAVDESTKLKKEYDVCREENEELKKKFKVLVTTLGARN